jgi:hypothetical protein
MSLRESELARSRRAARAHAKQNRKKKVRGPSVGIGRNQPLLVQPLAALLDDRVMTFAEWCQLNGIGIRTGRRILDGPSPPVVVQLSPRRIGITVRANREWQARRSRARTDAE